VDVIRRDGPTHDHHISRLADLPDQVARTLCYPPSQNLVTVFGDPDDVLLQIVGRVRDMLALGHSSILEETSWTLTA
jgi:hypothetical protein